MDIMSLMMGNVPQATASGKAAAGGAMPSPDQSGGLMGGNSPFLQLLGNSIQSKQLLPVSTGEVADPAEIMKQLMGAEPTAGTESAAKEGPAASVMNLLDGLRAMASERGRGLELTPEQREHVTSLLSELQQGFAGQNGVLSSGLQEALRGVLNPVVRKGEEPAAKLLSEVGGESSGEQNASEMTAALVASLNALLQQRPVRGETVKPLPKAESETALTVSEPVAVPKQAVMEKPVAMEPKGQQKLDSEATRAAVAEIPAESGKSSGFAVSTVQPPEAGAKNLDTVKPRQRSGQELKGPDAAALIDVQFQDEVQQPVKPGLSEAAPGKSIAGESPVTPELSKVAGQKGEQAASLKSEPFRPDMLIPSQPEAKMQPVSDVQPAAADARVAISHEQIISQIKEKLAEQRISADNGQVTLKLHPAELGELKITVRMDEQRIRVDVVAENRMVKDALMQNVDSLKDALARQNVAMERFDVSTGGRQLFDHGFREGRQQDQQFAPRGSAWLAGRNSAQTETAATQWQTGENALLDMMM